MDLTPAYFKAGMSAHMLALRDSAWERLKPAGPWALGDAVHPTAGRGCMVWWKDAKQPDAAELEWRECPDGLWYAPPLTLPDQIELARRNIPSCIDVAMSTGVTLSIPMAAASPRSIDFATGKVGKPASEFGRRAHALYDRLAGLPKDATVSAADPDVLMVLTLGVMTSYRVTPELLTDLAWFTTVDVLPTVGAIMGIDPKASEPGADG